MPQHVLHHGHCTCVLRNNEHRMLIDQGKCGAVEHFPRHACPPACAVSGERVHVPTRLGLAAPLQHMLLIHELNLVIV